jgi:hypothetical protein
MCTQQSNILPPPPKISLQPFGPCAYEISFGALMILSEKEYNIFVERKSRYVNVSNLVIFVTIALT